MATIGVLKSHSKGERRVAMVPDVAKMLCRKGHQVYVQKGAGEAATFGDAAYKEAGCIVAAEKEVLQKAQIFLTIDAVMPKTLEALPEKACVLGLLTAPAEAAVKSLQKKKVHLFALQRLPRISRAQAMDVLSSQSTIAGYAAVINAAQHAAGLFPLLMTAAGSTKAANVLVLGVGVAGLQAIGTARRLGAKVWAYDIRDEARSQAESLGASFVEIDLPEEASCVGEAKTGYAKQVSDAVLKAQQQALAKAAAGKDVVITTALVPGKKAPVLLTKEMTESLAPGGVVMDMAAPTGGNCALTKPGETIQHKGLTIVGDCHLASQYARDASSFFARNIQQFLDLLCDENRKVQSSFKDEILQATLLF